MGVNTAMESMGYAPFSTIERLLPYLDTYLMDIKHMDPAKHREWCGMENTLMVENAMRIAESGQTRLIIRVPVIPGFNDTEAEIKAIARYADTLPGVEEIHLLPYHNFGEGKYAGLHRDYPMGAAVRPSDEHMAALRDSVTRSTGLRCQIGG